MQKRTFRDALNKYIELGSDLNQRDAIGVKPMVSGLLKRLCPNEESTNDAVRRCLEYRRARDYLKVCPHRVPLVVKELWKTWTRY